MGWSPTVRAIGLYRQLAKQFRTEGKGNWIVSDWIAGAVYRIADDGTSMMLLNLDMGSADLEFIPDQSLLIVPMMLNNTLVAYQLE